MAVAFCSQGPHSHILMMGWRGLSAFIGSEIFTKGDFFWVYERHWDFLSHEKKNGDF